MYDEILKSIKDAESLIRRLQSTTGLGEDSIKEIAQLSLEPHHNAASDSLKEDLVEEAFRRYLKNPN